jgi:hypothetical protein
MSSGSSPLNTAVHERQIEEFSLTEIFLSFAEQVFAVFAFDAFNQLPFSGDGFVEHKEALVQNTDGESLTICFLFSEQIRSSKGAADNSTCVRASTSKNCSAPSSLVTSSFNF